MMPDGSAVVEPFDYRIPDELMGEGIWLFTDGSCTTHPLDDRRRAAWSLVWAQADSGKPMAILSGLVPYGWPQTPQAAEYLAALAASNAGRPRQPVWSDCAGVIRHFGRPSASRLDPQLMYSGVVRAALGGDGWASAAAMSKVAAHQDIASIHDAADKAKAIGNAAADTAAKDARERHPRGPPAFEEAWDLQWGVAAATAAIVAEAGRLWPPARPPKGCRPAAPPRDRVAKLEAKTRRARANRDSHAWAVCKSRSKCVACGVRASSAAAAATPCPGLSRSKIELVQTAKARGHRLSLAAVWRPGEEAAGMVICMRCGSFVEDGWSRSLSSADCKPAAGKSRLDALQRARRGLFPKAGKDAKGITLELLQPL